MERSDNEDPQVSEPAETAADPTVVAAGVEAGNVVEVEVAAVAASIVVDAAILAATPAAVATGVAASPAPLARVVPALELFELQLASVRITRAHAATDGTRIIAA